MIRRTIELGRYLVYIAVISSFIASLMTFLVGAIRLAENGVAFYKGASSGHVPTEIGINMIAVVDAFLLGTILYIFAVGLYELFIGDLEVPSWLTVNNLDDLKAKLQSVIIMIMAVLFLEHLAHWKDPLETLMFGGAIALVTFALVFYGSKKEKEKKAGKHDPQGHEPDYKPAPANQMGTGDAAALKLKKKAPEPVELEGDHHN